MSWLTLIISLPGRSTTPRMRIWRALKASGAGILRDGVYLLPDTAEHRAVFEQQAQEVQALDGSAYVLHHDPEDTTAFDALFDRSADYSDWHERVKALVDSLHSLDEPKARRDEAQLRRDLETIVKIDFFANQAKDDALTAMRDASDRINRHFSPGEPTTGKGEISVQQRSAFCQRTWVTRSNLWVDRVASAWLIKRYIDTKAQFLWLDDVTSAPADTVGFDFDGAAFTHVDRFVTFEVLLKSFELETDVALAKLGALVHYLDVGGIAVADGPGVVAILAGAKKQSTDDDSFARRTFALLDNLYAAYCDQES